MSSAASCRTMPPGSHDTLLRRRELTALVPGDRIWLFGSLTQPGRFNDASDVDLALEAEPIAMSAGRLSSELSERLALASLNHPNIAAIYGIEESHPSTGSGHGDVRALVMELVEGEDLSAHRDG